MDVVRWMFAKQITSKIKKHNPSTSTPSERCELPRVSTGGGGSVRRRRESSITPARASSAKTCKNLNDQSKNEDVSYNLQVIDDETGRRIIRQHTCIANNIPTDIADYNSHSNIYDVRGN